MLSEQIQAKSKSLSQQTFSDTSENVEVLSSNSSGESSSSDSEISGPPQNDIDTEERKQPRRGRGKEAIKCTVPYAQEALLVYPPNVRIPAAAK